MLIFLAFLVLATGGAVNVHNSADPVIDSPKEFAGRAWDGVQAGYGRDHFVGYALNE